MPDRRQFLLSLGTAVAAGNFSLSDPARAGLPEDADYDGIVVYRPEIRTSRDFARALEAAGAQIVVLAEDPVRQWRDSLRSLLRESRVPLYGMTDWSDYQLMRGLGVELRRHVRHESVHEDRWQTLYTWVIA